MFTYWGSALLIDIDVFDRLRSIRKVILFPIYISKFFLLVC